MRRATDMRPSPRWPAFGQARSQPPGTHGSGSSTDVNARKHAAFGVHNFQQAGFGQRIEQLTSALPIVFVRHALPEHRDLRHGHGSLARDDVALDELDREAEFLDGGNERRERVACHSFVRSWERNTYFPPRTIHMLTTGVVMSPARSKATGPIGVSATVLFAISATTCARVGGTPPLRDMRDRMASIAACAAA